MKKHILILGLFVILSSCSNNDDDVIIDDGPIFVPDPVSNSITPCANGMAGVYPCNGYDLVAQINLAGLGGASGNDSWGWTDPTTQKEYALMGLNSGTVFIDISDPVNPVVLGNLPTATVSSTWRDVKTYGNYAFIVSEAPGHGMQIFDLTRLRTLTSFQTFAADAHYTGFGDAHNIVINEANGYAYAVGTYSHDAQVVTYNGPDTDYTGREIYIGSNEDEVIIADITDKSNPISISTVSYSNIGYTHQGWFTEDMNYFILGDEADEQNTGGNTRAIVFDFTDLDNPSFHMNYFGPTSAIDHNGYVKGNLFFQANYSAGVRMIDITNIASGTMTEVGFFDTNPDNNNTSFDGAWNVYPYFPSGNIIISDTERGFFIIKKR